MSSCVARETEGTYKDKSGDSKDLCQPCGLKAKSTEKRTNCICHQSATDRALKRYIFDPKTRNCKDMSDDPSKLPDSNFISGMQTTKNIEYQCEKGYWCFGGIRYPCPQGRFGDQTKEKNPLCAGKCSQGYWCGESSTNPIANECGGMNLFCPAGSSTPHYVSAGHFTTEDEPSSHRSSQKICPPGYYCAEGKRHECPPGRYGKKEGLSDPICDGSCSAGFYCPSGSSNEKQMPCGNITGECTAGAWTQQHCWNYEPTSYLSFISNMTLSVHCPTGSVNPTLTTRGKYSFRSAVQEATVAMMNATMSNQAECEPGHFCQDGTKYQCPEGTYSEVHGARQEEDCFPCLAGFYCPSYPGPPSTNAAQKKCGGIHLFCPEGSARPLYVSVGHYSLGGENSGENSVNVRTDQNKCPPGSWCQSGVKQPCPAGTFGDASGLVERTCSGFCPAGSYCEEGSEKPVECPEGTYAVPGSWRCIPCGNSLFGGLKPRCKTSRICCSQ